MNFLKGQEVDLVDIVKTQNGWKEKMGVTFHQERTHV